jgi:L-aminopeptidase/D-esterase-like protein
VPARRSEPTLTAVRGVRVGCAEDPTLPSGVSAVLFDVPAPTVVDVRGPASGTYDTHSLGLEATFGRRDALFLSGGSVYGLDAGRGVRTALLEAGRGTPVFGGGFPVPRVSGAILYDLPRSPGPIPDYLPLGYSAARLADRRPVPSGRVGAGRGARVAKYLGPKGAVPGGQGSACLPAGRGHRIGVLLVLNSVGAVRDVPSGRWLAEARGAGRRRSAPGASVPPRSAASAAGTSLAIVVTDEPLPRRILYAVAERTHDGIARVVRPAHTSTEGDVVFAATTGGEPAGAWSEPRPGATADRLGALAETLVERAARVLFAPGATD